MSFEIPGVLWRRDPEAVEVPLVFDSPHSGSDYPEDFRFTCPLETLRRAEDAYVDELYAAAPAHGATLIAALFPRSYLDPNRGADDIDEALIDGRWPTALKPSQNTRAGLGLVRRVARPSTPIYDGKLTVHEVLTRIERCHAPYHRVLDEACTRLHATFGTVWHVNCHSMPSKRSARDIGRPADFVLGDRDARLAPRNLPISSQACCAAAAMTSASTRSTRASKSSSARAGRRRAGTACRSRSIARSTWTRRFQKNANFPNFSRTSPT